MKPAERFVDVDQSDFIIRTPSAIARRTFLYLLRAGEFVYEPGYRLERGSFDSFLVAYVRSGSLDLRLPNTSCRAEAGQFAVVDCYATHAYGTDEATDVLWVHFDGIMARAYYEMIVGKLGNAFSLRDSAAATNRLRQIVELSRGTSGFCEARMSKYLTDVLTEFAAEQEPGASARQSQSVEDCLAYIAAHLSEPLTVDDLASRAFLSKYHFIRVFKKETGTTPHAYIVDARIHAAKYLLVNGSAQLGRICEQCGFSSTSVFCAVFKRKVGVSPLEYRANNQGRRP
ncbi:AraC family transcriptional regulator [Bifidobacterium eulemuris]|uniref:Helix-turn-helix transcriptional regulator n=1 Tax=Bifidobacterium eulemuris TaxID=1765219 RepID=A0A261FY93_9BIFI|nr:AraC family transcriptional regulator [Bifidobacterium eulemuris]OZG64068.1 Transcriptional regulator, AraC family [Bifidobacterium eulemuris]QOL32573.1 helix-turn-helix transcriptional regulator [Bifidobacterium eulemuris]